MKLSNFFKRTVSITAAALILASALCISTSAAPNGKDLGSVAQVKAAAVKVDGKKDAAYDNALKLKTAHNPDAAVYADIWVLWQKGYITFYAEVTDPKLEDKGTAKQTSAPWENDSIEIFVDDNNDGVNYGMQYRVDFTGYGTWKDRNANKNYYTTDKCTGVFEWAAVKTDKGYTAEMSVPCSAKEGDKVGIMFQVNGISGTSLLEKTSGTSGWDTKDYPFVTLGAMVAEKAPAKAPTTAPATADPITLAALAVLASGAAFVAVGKKR